MGSTRERDRGRGKGSRSNSLYLKAFLSWLCLYYRDPSKTLILPAVSMMVAREGVEAACVVKLRHRQVS